MASLWCQHGAMELEPYIEEIHRQLTLAAEASGEEARALADRLAAPLDAAIRLALQDALSAAAEEITVELAPGSVELRLRGRTPEFVVTPPPADPTSDDADVERHESGGVARCRRRRGLGRADQPASARVPEGTHRTSRGRRRAVGQLLVRPDVGRRTRTRRGHSSSRTTHPARRSALLRLGALATEEERQCLRSILPNRSPSAWRWESATSGSTRPTGPTRSSRSVRAIPRRRAMSPPPSRRAWSTRTATSR